MPFFGIIERIIEGKHPKICVSLSNYAHISPDLIEFRADLCDNDPMECLNSLKNNGDTPVVVTNRGGDYKIFLSSGLCDMIDVDIRENDLAETSACASGDTSACASGDTSACDTPCMTVVDLAHRAGCPVILSYHDYESTPEDLEPITKRLRAGGAELTKLACLAHKEEDVDRIMAADADITIAMGPLGLRSRREAKLITYQSYGIPTAPGQEEYTGE